MWLAIYIGESVSTLMYLLKNMWVPKFSNLFYRFNHLSPEEFIYHGFMGFDHEISFILVCLLYVSSSFGVFVGSCTFGQVGDSGALRSMNRIGAEQLNLDSNVRAGVGRHPSWPSKPMGLYEVLKNYSVAQRNSLFTKSLRRDLTYI